IVHRSSGFRPNPEKREDLLNAKRAPGERYGDLIAAHFAQGDLDNLREGGAIENARDRVAHVEHQHPETAVSFIRAGAAMVCGLAHTGDRRKRTIEHADDCTQLDARCWLGQGITAELAALGFNVTGQAQLSEDLFEKL